MTEAIRILHVLTAMNMAGTETLLMNFYRNINRNEIQFDFAVSAINECAYDKEIEELGGKIIHYPKYTGTNHFQYVKWWNRFLEKHPEYHIIHGHIGSTAAIYLKIAKKHGRFTVAHSHSTESPLSIHSLFYKVYSYPTRFIADQFFGCSKKALIDRYGKRVANSANARVINNAIDAKAFQYDPRIRDSVRKEFDLSQNQVVLGTIGRLAPQKNPLMTIRIISELKKKGIQFKFLWIGTGDMKEDIEKSIRKNGLDNEVIMLGVRNDIQRLLQAIDIFIFPSLWEGLGIVAIEAQASGVPTLCSDQVPEEAKITDLCEYISLSNINDWCNSIEKIVISINQGTYHRRNTYSEVVRANYDINDVAKWLQLFYLDCYERV